MITNADAPHSDLPDDADGAIRQLYSDHAEALPNPARRFCPDVPRAPERLVETFYHGGTTAIVARRLGIPHGAARSRLHYALHALRAHLQDQDAAACP